MHIRDDSPELMRVLVDNRHLVLRSFVYKDSRYVLILLWPVSEDVKVLPRESKEVGDL